MSKSRSRRFHWQALSGSAASVLLLCSLGLAGPATAGVITLCPSQANPGVGGFGVVGTDVAGPLDATCGADSAVKIDIGASTDYGKLQFGSSTPGWPTGLTLAGLGGLSANVDYSTGGSDQPYFLLPFIDSSDSLGQGAASDQILMIEFQSNALSGNTLAADPSTTLFNLYDNTTGSYLQGGQHHTNTIAGWLSTYTALDSEELQGIWIGEGLTGTDTGAESLTVNSLDVTVPEPSSIALFGAALAGLGFMGFTRRRRAGRASA